MMCSVVNPKGVVVSKIVLAWESFTRDKAPNVFPKVFRTDGDPSLADVSFSLSYSLCSVTGSARTTFVVSVGKYHNL